MSAETWIAVGSFATAVSAFVAAIQLRRGVQQEYTRFEDGLTQQYRAILALLPLPLLFEAPESDSVSDEEMNALYRYFDLCNEQVFLRSKGRIRKKTWVDWRAGIKGNLKKPGFRAAWKCMEKKIAFAELRCFIADAEQDPHSGPWRKRLVTIEREVELRG